MKKICEDPNRSDPWILYNESNMEVNSYKCGTNVKISTCKEYANKYNCESYDEAWIASSSGAMAIGEFGYHLDWNDIYSFKVESYDPNLKGAATLFSESNCYGYSSSFEYDPEYSYNGASEYLKAGMYKMGHRDGDTEGIKVPYGY
jgi:hypothetical protein